MNPKSANSFLHFISNAKLKARLCNQLAARFHLSSLQSPTISDALLTFKEHFNQICLLDWVSENDPVDWKEQEKLSKITPCLLRTTKSLFVPILKNSPDKSRFYKGIQLFTQNKFLDDVLLDFSIKKMHREKLFGQVGSIRDFFRWGTAQIDFTNIPNNFQKNLLAKVEPLLPDQELQGFLEFLQNTQKEKKFLRFVNMAVLSDSLLAGVIAEFEIVDHTKREEIIELFRKIFTKNFMAPVVVLEGSKVELSILNTPNHDSTGSQPGGLALGIYELFDKQKVLNAAPQSLKKEGASS